MQEEKDKAAEAVETAAEEISPEQLWQDAVAARNNRQDTEVFKQETDAEDQQGQKAEDTSEDQSEKTADTEDDTSEGEKSEHEKLKEQNERLQHALKSDNGRYVASQREIAELRKEKRALEARLADPSPKIDRKALEKFREELPEAKPLADHFDQQTAHAEKMRAADQGRLDSLTKQEVELSEREQKVFLKEHPDGWDYLKDNGEAIEKWVDDQPRRIRNVWDQNFESMVNGTEVAALLTEYKQSLVSAPEESSQAEKAALDAKRDLQKSGARAPAASERKAVLSDVPADASRQDQWNYFVKKRRAARS